jgi:hypothetical protein
MHPDLPTAECLQDGCKLVELLGLGILPEYWDLDVGDAQASDPVRLIYQRLRRGGES